MLKKVIFAAVLSIGFMASFQVGAAGPVDSGSSLMCDYMDPDCRKCGPAGCD